MPESYNKEENNKGLPSCGKLDPLYIAGRKQIYEACWGLALENSLLVLQKANHRVPIRPRVTSSPRYTLKQTEQGT